MQLRKNLPCQEEVELSFLFLPHRRWCFLEEKITGIDSIMSQKTAGTMASKRENSKKTVAEIVWR